jgi:hypothetical protein
MVLPTPGEPENRTEIPAAPRKPHSSRDPAPLADREHDLAQRGERVVVGDDVVDRVGRVERLAEPRQPPVELLAHRPIELRGGGIGQAGGGLRGARGHLDHAAGDGVALGERAGGLGRELGEAALPQLGARGQRGHGERDVDDGAHAERRQPVAVDGDGDGAGPQRAQRVHEPGDLGALAGQVVEVRDRGEAGVDLDGERERQRGALARVEVERAHELDQRQRAAAGERALDPRLEQRRVAQVRVEDPPQLLAQVLLGGLEVAHERDVDPAAARLRSWIVVPLIAAQA